MIQYLDLLRHVMEPGRFKADRTGTGTYSLFGAQARYPLAEGFPLLTTKDIQLCQRSDPFLRQGKPNSFHLN